MSAPLTAGNPIEAILDQINEVQSRLVDINENAINASLHAAVVALNALGMTLAIVSDLLVTGATVFDFDVKEWNR